RQQQDQISGQKQINQAAAQVTAAQDNLKLQTEAKPNTIAADQASIASAQTQVDSAQTARNGTTLTAPMSGYVVSVTGQVGDTVLVVPSSAITRRGQAATVTVLMADGTRVITPIETGVVGDSTTEVTGGLNEGDRVLLPTLNSATRSNNGVVFGGGRGPGG